MIQGKQIRNNWIGFLVVPFIVHRFPLVSLSAIYSINLFDSIISLTPLNSECGFYSMLISMLKYKFNYWMVTIHFLIHEQELISVLPIIYGLKTLTENWLLWCLLGFPPVDLLVNCWASLLLVLLFQFIINWYYYCMINVGNNSES